MKIKNLLLTILGFILLGIGGIGLLIPVLPTTPFILVSAACFTSNPAVHSRLIKSKFFGDHLRNYRQRQGLKKSTVVISLTFLWVMLCLSMALIAKLWLTLLLSSIGIAVTIHILCVARPKKR